MVNFLKFSVLLAARYVIILCKSDIHCGLAHGPLTVKESIPPPRVKQIFTTVPCEDTSSDTANSIRPAPNCNTATMPEALIVLQVSLRREIAGHKIGVAYLVFAPLLRRGRKKETANCFQRET